MTLYDRVDWHVESAIAAGQPEENAFAHAGFYLAWLIRRDLHDPDLLPPEHVEAVRRREMTGSDLIDDIDGKLGDWLMTQEGRAFSDARYDAYLDAFGRRFAQDPDYSVVDDAATYEVVEGLLDTLYAAWIADGRPVAVPKDPLGGEPPPPTHVSIMLPPDVSDDQLPELLKPWPDAEVTVVRSGGDLRGPHVAPELEALVPRDLTSPPMDVKSRSARRWRSSQLNRALKRLGVRPADAVVVTGLGGSGRGTLSVTIYCVPGIGAARLADEFQSVFPRLPGSKRFERAIDDRVVTWAAFSEFELAYWARDGLAFGVGGAPENVERAIRRLP